MAWTREQLNRSQCDHADCPHQGDHPDGPLFFHSKCHPSSRLAYELLVRDTDVPTLSLACRECGAYTGEVLLDLRDKDGVSRTPPVILRCTHDDDIVLYFQDDMMIICDTCNKARYVLRVLSVEN